MCLAIPAQIISVDAIHNMATASLSGVQVEVSLALLDEAKPGDYVLVHVGYALSRIDEQEALNTLELFAEMHDEIH
jgi:hydrogenase expression/formation protein HypC